MGCLKGHIMDKRLAQWVETIKGAFRDGPPNGWILGWPEKRHAEALARLTAPGEFFNKTSFDYWFCNTYEVYYPNSSVSNVKLTIQISFIVDAFEVYWDTYIKGAAVKPHGQVSIDDLKIDITQNVCSYLESQGFVQVPDEWDGLKIPDVKLELSEPEDVTLNKCLFRDFDG